ncbi:pE66L [African swine fever virus]|uniref:PE66L n=1 Tax=African swine fever virus TaxID=10497 RepID=A0A8A1V360_ASF|nr:pE66L [African swine fever virus]QST87054.1 pE66L [African swine fever virus]
MVTCYMHMCMHMCIHMCIQHMVTLYAIYAHIICIQNMVILMRYMHIYVFY